MLIVLSQWLTVSQARLERSPQLQNCLVYNHSIGSCTHSCLCLKVLSALSTGSVSPRPHLWIASPLTMSNSLLLHLQVRPRLVDGSPANWVSSAAKDPPIELVIYNRTIVALRSSSVPSSSQSSPASSPRAALLLPIFALRLTRRQSLTPCKAPK